MIKLIIICISLSFSFQTLACSEYLSGESSSVVIDFIEDLKAFDSESSLDQLLDLFKKSKSTQVLEIQEMLIDIQKSFYLKSPDYPKASSHLREFYLELAQNMYAKNSKQFVEYFKKYPVLIPFSLSDLKALAPGTDEKYFFIIPQNIKGELVLDIQIGTEYFEMSLFPLSDFGDKFIQPKQSRAKEIEGLDISWEKIESYSERELYLIEVNLIRDI